jgi:hypothetical protein
MTAAPARRYDAGMLIDLLNEAYRAKAWHGPTLRGSLHGITAEQAVWRPAKGRHNIWEVAVHAAYWKLVARRRILNTRGIAFTEPGSNWFPRITASEAAWKSDITHLDLEHAALVALIETLSPAVLNEPKNIRLIRGIAMHDAYHAGQIKLLAKLRGDAR